MSRKVRPASIAVTGSSRALPAAARPMGAPQPDETLDVTLRLRAPAVQPRGVPAQPMTRTAFAREYGASADDLTRVEDFAREHGLDTVESSAARRTVILRGSVAQMQEAFGVTLGLYENDGVTFRGRSGPVHVPADLAGIVEGVFGLDDRPQARPQFRLGSPVGQPGVAFPHAAGHGYTPVELAQAYQFPPGDGAGQTIAIIELGGGYTEADLSAYFTGLGLTTPAVTAVEVNGGRNDPSGDPSSADGEVLLDIEVAGAVAPGARIAVYFAPNTDAGFLNAITTAVHDAERRPSVVSISWGAAEAAWTEQAMRAMDDAFHDAAMLGVTVLCAAGDDGSGDRVGDGLAHTDFPASSPWATGCGGTRLDLDGGGRIAREVVWNTPGHGATGGGVSDVFPVPDYQQRVGVPPSANPGRRVGRGVPDIAGVADPQTGYRVRVDGQDMVIGGTSAVAPLWAGLVARLNAGREQPLGFLNPLLYGAGAQRDITSGDNGAYRAADGWDACTGLGSPDGQRWPALAGTGTAEQP
ncbi:kumamolisin [Deinococcus metalli]|uniref:Kumamolisin n=1 Tax=Deinococcus metalli TaxID=1141878 RepID=A0A7W8NQE3_9DEIO|nr:S53 family peptidase [Deinococcus metalli]MBB5376700.1 kumamolisin [Deinococcus metalli]GHF65799.1 kumamolisin [Deinococcus metalli]